MIKKVIEISREPAYLSVRQGQLLVTRPESDPPVAPASIPCEDIGLIMVDHPQVTYSHQALASLLDSGAVVVLCGRNHLPAGLLLPMAGHSELGNRLASQIAVGKPLLKRLWKQIVMEKIRAQARGLTATSSAQGRLLALAGTVKSGDTSNVEAHAAKVYWAAWAESMPTFRRDHSSDDAANSLLNYGYAVLRAAVARALVSAGLLPSLGIHHHHRANSFALADDLMEPFRPLIDSRVRDVLQDNPQTGLDQATKARLLEVLTATVQDGENSGPLMVALHRMCASLVDCYDGAASRLLIPQFVLPGSGHGA